MHLRRPLLRTNYLWNYMEIFTRRILITTNLLVRYTMGPLPLLVLLNQRNYAGGNEIEYQKLLFPNL